MKNLKAVTDKRISNLTNALNKLSDQVNVLPTFSTYSSYSIKHTDPSNKCWLYSAEKLGLKKKETSESKPT